MKQNFDTQGLGCGQLVLELRKRVDQLHPGEQIEVIAHDSSVGLDLLAWCRMTGNEMVSDQYPRYVIQRRKTKPG